MANSYDRQFHHSYLVDNSSSSSLRTPDRGNEAKAMNSPETRFLGHESTMPNDGLHSGNNTKRHFMPGTLFADLSLILLPAAALGFAVAVMCLDNKTVEKEVLAKWDNAITVIASIFPILFASVASRMVFQAARWNLEKGATLNLLEQLIGSRTVGSTLVTQISLGRFNFLGVALLILWSLSPLGSQSALRMLRTKLEPIHANSSVLYYTTDAPSVFRSAELRNSRGDIDSYRSTQAYMQTMYSALLLAPPAAKSNVMDLWGNVKIPKLEVDGDDRGWKNVSSWNSEPDSYSSLVGLPVTNVTQGNTTFSLESSYIDLDCKLNYNISALDVQWYEWDPYMGGTNNGSIRLRNGTWHGLNSSYLQTVWSIGVDRFVDEYWNVNDRCPSVGEKKDCSRPSLLINETDLDVRPAQLVFESSFRTSPWQYIPSMRVEAICGVYQRYVESRVACSREGSSSPQNCTVIQQRFSRKPHADERVTSLSFPDIWGWVTRGLPEGVKQQSYADNTIRYLNNPGIRSFAVGEQEEEADMLRNVTKEQFGRRLSQLINTYVLLGQLNQYASQGNSDAIANFAPNVTVPVDVSNLEEIYVVHWNWMALFFACCGVLLGSGIVGVVFAHLAAGPEILGYASSAVRDSKYLNLPADAGEKEALDVTKMIGQQRFKYGYTNALSEEGRPLMGISLENEVQGIKRRSSGKGNAG